MIIDFINKLNLSIDNYRQISSTINLSTAFSMIDFNRFDNYCFYIQHLVLQNYLLFLLQINRSSESGHLNAPINGPGWGGGGGRRKPRGI